MNILTIENLTKAYTDRLLFDGASFSVQEGEKVGIIGINGTGKSTLLRIIAGEEEPDGGSVIRANHIVMRYLSQDPQLDMERACWTMCWNRRLLTTAGILRERQNPCLQSLGLPI